MRICVLWLPPSSDGGRRTPAVLNRPYAPLGEDGAHAKPDDGTGPARAPRARAPKRVADGLGGRGGHRGRPMDCGRHRGGRVGIRLVRYGSHRQAISLSLAPKLSRRRWSHDCLAKGLRFSRPREGDQCVLGPDFRVAVNETGGAVPQDDSEQGTPRQL